MVPNIIYKATRELKARRPLGPYNNYDLITPVPTTV